MTERGTTQSRIFFKDYKDGRFCGLSPPEARAGTSEFFASVKGVWALFGGACAIAAKASGADCRAKTLDGRRKSVGAAVSLIVFARREKHLFARREKHLDDAYESGKLDNAEGGTPVTRPKYCRRC